MLLSEHNFLDYFYLNIVFWWSSIVVILMLFFLSLLACEIKPITVEPEDFPEHQSSDYDKDGFSENDDDCNDQNVEIGPGFIE